MESETNNKTSLFTKVKGFVKTIDKKDIAIMIIIPSILIPAYLIYKQKKNNKL